MTNSWNIIFKAGTYVGPTTNLLKGTILPLDAATNASAYKFNFENYIPRFSASGNLVDAIIPCNSAYLAPADAGYADYNVDPTYVVGIKSIFNANADKTYYDLNGRRVVNPGRGIYINAKGQKVLRLK